MKKIILILLFALSILKAQNIDSLQNNLFNYVNKKGYDSTAFDLCIQLYNAYIDTNYQMAMQFAALAEQIASKLKDSMKLASAYTMLGKCYMRQHTYFMATEAFFKAYDIYRQKNNDTLMAYSLTNIAQAYIKQEIEDIAIEKLKTALHIFKNNNNNKGLIHTYLLMSKAYMDTKPRKSISMLKKTMKLAQKSNHIADIYYLLAKAYNQLSFLDSSLFFLNKAFIEYKKNNDLINIAQTHLFFGEIYLEHAQQEFALKHINSAAKLFQQINQKDKLAKAYYLLAKIYFNNQNYTKASKYATEALNISNTINLIDIKPNILAILSDIYQKQNNTSQALIFQKKYAQALKEYYEYKKTQRFSSLQMNLEAQNKEKDIQIFKMKAQQEKLKMEKRLYKRNLLYGIIIGLLALIILIFMIIRYREKNKNEKLLKETNELLKHEIFVRKKAENNMRESEARYKLLFKKMPIGILQFNEDFIISDVNEKLLEILKLSKNQLVGKSLNYILDRNLTKQITEFFQSDKEIFSTETQIVLKSKLLYVSLTIKKYKFSTDNGIISGGIIIVEDLTAKKQTEDLIKHKYLVKEKIFNLLPDDIVLTNLNGDIIAIHFPSNPEFERTATTIEQIIPQKWKDKFFKYFELVRETGYPQRFVVENIYQNYFIRIIPEPKQETILVMFINLERKDKKLIEKARREKHLSEKQKYYRELKYAIENELLGTYRNLQRGMSFIMIKNFAERIINIAQKFNNPELKNYGNQLLEAITAFDVLKINKILDQFPSLINQFSQEERFIL